MNASEQPAPHTADEVGGNGTHRGAARPARPAAWWIYHGTGRPRPELDIAEALPDPPGWRRFDGGPPLPPPEGDDREVARRLGIGGHLPESLVDQREVDMVNAALYLRRPLLVTGKPGTGKSSLAYRITRELKLGPVLRWPITSRSTLKSGLYEYDAIGRAQAIGAVRAGAPDAGTGGPDIGDYLQLGPLGTALLPYRVPRVLLIDELDKSDIDLPNDLLNVFEEGEFRIPELVRVAAHQPTVNVLTSDAGVKAPVRNGLVRCRAFPVVVITSNGEREFPAPFLRRCLRLEMSDPDEARLARMVAAHFDQDADDSSRELVRAFVERSDQVGGLAADQLLNAVYLATSGAYRADDESWPRLREALWQRLIVDEPT